MFEDSAGVQARVLVLPADHLRALLHVGHRVLGQLLAGQPLRARQGGPGGHHPPHHVHPDRRGQQVPAPRRLHQGHRRLERGLRPLCLLRSPGVCHRQLRFQIGYEEGEIEEVEPISTGNSSTMNLYRKIQW